MNKTALADVFFGNGEVDHFPAKGHASKWFFIKALCGNTTPHACLPFGRMSVGAYTGGYPTGYGTHYPNSCGGIHKLSRQPEILGFSHLHQSGTGGIRYYYNYAVTTPFRGTPDKRHAPRLLVKEEAVPGYYKAELNDGTLCELTVTKGCALHRYTFPFKGGKVCVDFGLNGLSSRFGITLPPKEPKLFLRDDMACFEGIFAGIRLYFCAVGTKGKLFEGDTLCRENTLCPAKDRFGVQFEAEGRSAELRVAFSTVSFEKAAAFCRTPDFDTARTEADEAWEQALSMVDIQTNDKALEKRFYSCLYHSLIKPAEFEGETVLGMPVAAVDMATLWDQYKTLYPLIFLLYPAMGKNLVQTLVSVSRHRGKIPCSLGLAEVFPCEEQAKLLGIFALCDAYYCHLATKEDIRECLCRELAHPDFAPLKQTGFFERYTHILDAADACACCAGILTEISEELKALAAKRDNAYGDDGLLSQSSPYYEGDRYTYSFRIHPDMESRIALSGGKEKFAEQLDRFFGFDGESISPITHLNADKEIAATQYHRFEGFNNECDMEAPYAYLFAGRHDRTSEIVRECVNVSFTSGKGGLPGNNDSGGLTSCFVWNALGLFPATGTGELLLGAPQVQQAVLHLPAGKKLTVQTNIPGGTHIESITLNGVPVKDFRLPVAEILGGGTLVFTFSD